jgi:uncharacterized protein (TIGR00725 family)
VSGASTNPYIAVIGSGDAGAGLLGDAERVGRRLGEAGALVICGGLGGVMEAACRGARAAGATTIGLLPGSDRSAANEHVAIAIATGLGELRNCLVVRAADAVVAIGGEFGTLSEIGFALRLGVPVVGLGTWELARGGVADERIVRADDAEDAAQRALELASGRDAGAGRGRGGSPTAP